MNSGRDLWSEIAYAVISCAPRDKLDQLQGNIDKIKNPTTKLAFEAAHLARAMLNIQPAERVEKLKDVPAEQRGFVEARLLTEVAITDPAIAAKYFLSENCSCTPNKLLTYHLLTSWVNKDPEAASIAIRDAPPSPRKNYAIANLVKNICRNDSTSADIWLAEISDKILQNECAEYLRKYGQKPIQ